MLALISGSRWEESRSYRHKEKVNGPLQRALRRKMSGSIGEDLEAKLESARDATRDGLSKACDSTESLYRDARSATERKADEASYAAESKKEEAKTGWFSWLGWGRSKVDEGKGKTEAEADRVEREGAQKVADASESVK